MTSIAARTLGWLKWQRLLASCDYDPAHDAEVEEMSSLDFIIAGCPRSGTSLLAAQLFRPPDVVTCMEPWDGLRMPVAELARELRAEISSGYLSRGRLDVHVLEAESRVRWIKDGERRFPVSVNPGVQLGVKWPAYWRYLEVLERTRFLICVRDPVDVVSSFAKTGGRLANGYDYDVAINDEMNRWLRSSSSDAGARRALMWEYINSRVLRYLDKENVKVVHYERWFEEPDTLLAEIGSFLGLPLRGSTVTLRPPEPTKDATIASLVSEHCPSAPLLGYGR